MKNNTKKEKGGINLLFPNDSAENSLDLNNFIRIINHSNFQIYPNLQ